MTTHALFLGKLGIMNTGEGEPIISVIIVRGFLNKFSRPPRPRLYGFS